MVAGLAAFISGYVAIAWLLRYLAKHTLGVFIVYRVVLGALVIVLATMGLID